MDRETFIKKMIHENPKVSAKEKDLVAAMKIIDNYFSEIYNEYAKQDLAPMLFSTGSDGVSSTVIASYKNNGLSFDRKNEVIDVRLSTDKFLTSKFIQELDTIKLHNNVLTSERFNLPLSEKLLDKYLEFLMN